MNCIWTTDGGTHEIGLKEGIAKAVIKYGLDNKLLKEKQISNDDTREGLIAILNLSMKDPVFDGQNKHKLSSKNARGVVREVVFNYFYDQLMQQPDVAKAIIDKAVKSAKARDAAAKARDAARNIKDIVEAPTGLPGKLADCSSKKPEECEIFLVEGDSAAGSAKQGRDRHFQAILPIFGKILNVAKVNSDKVYNNIKLQDIVKALRCGVGDTFDINKLRYHKIILMADADC